MIKSVTNKKVERIAHTVHEVAEMLGVSLYDVRKACREGGLDCFKVGNRYLVLDKDLYIYIDKLKDECMVLQITDKHQ